MAQCDARIKDPNVVCIDWKRCTNPAVWIAPGVSYDHHTCDEHLQITKHDVPRVKFERIKMSRFRVTEIDYEEDISVVGHRPQELEIELRENEKIDNIADRIYDRTGLLVNGFRYEEL